MEEDKPQVKGILSKILDFYDREYKKLLIIPIILLVLAIAQISIQTATTGDFINKGVSLKGGITITILNENIEVAQLETSLKSIFNNNDLSVRSLEKTGQIIGVAIEIDLDESKTDSLIKEINTITGLDLKEGDYTIEVMGSSLGASFFKEILKAIFIAFLFMGVVVFLYFGEGIKLKVIAAIMAFLSAIFIFVTKDPITDVISYILGIMLIIIYLRSSIASFAVILAAASDIIITLAIINLTGMKLSSAGIAAFLMLIGYSVDTDMLLSTRVLKRKEGTVFDRVMSSFKTGILMSITTLTAVTIALIFTESEVIRQIMVILLVGLLVDLINTWIQNVSILRMWLDKKHKHN